MNKIENLLIDLKNKYDDIKSSDLDANTAFIIFYQYFDEQYQSLSKEDKNNLMLMLERDIKLKKLLEYENI
jgi:hypothetical protein